MAKVAVVTTDTIRSTIARRVTNHVSKPLATTPQRSVRRRFYDQLASVCLAAARIYISVDNDFNINLLNTAIHHSHSIALILHICRTVFYLFV